MNYQYDILKESYSDGLKVINLLKNLKFNYATQDLSRQLIKSSTFVGANLIEGQASSSRKEMKRYYRIALKSSSESIYWTNLLSDSNVITKQNKEELIQTFIKLSKMISTCILKL